MNKEEYINVVWEQVEPKLQPSADKEEAKLCIGTLYDRKMPASVAVRFHDFFEDVDPSLSEEYACMMIDRYLARYPLV